MKKEVANILSKRIKYIIKKLDKMEKVLEKKNK